jgi:spore coat polysaccharide biosynthesis predicted glycosyltransferase SpsG
MNRYPILFRCDGTAEQGYEPLYQCLAYAAALQRRRRGTHFLSLLTPAAPLVSAVQRPGNEWRPAEAPAGSPDDLRDTVREVRRLQAAAVVVACPDLSAAYLEELAETGALVVVLDARATLTWPADLVVNPLLGPGRDAYHGGPRCQFLIGARYALVRPMVRRMRPVRAQEPPQPYRALVALGDDDPKGQVLPRVRELMQTSRIDRVDVALRSHHAALPELRATAEEHPTRLGVATEPGEVSQRVSRCHFALTSGDGWSLELACVGVPQLMLLQAEHHRPNAQRLDDEGAATLLCDAEAVTPLALRTAVQTLLSDPMERAGMARCGRHLIDGRGPDRLVNAVEILLNPARPQQQQLRLVA